jgi:hypothetical protein
MLNLSNMLFRKIEIMAIEKIKKTPHGLLAQCTGTW